jgi:ribosome modulation factor
MSVSQGYQNGLAGRNCADDSADYMRGWVTGWRERMLAWNSASKPIDIAKKGGVS